MKRKIIPILVMGLMLATTALPALADSAGYGQTGIKPLAMADVTIDEAFATDWAINETHHGERIREFPIDDAVYFWLVVLADDLSGVTITHRWMYDNGTGLVNHWEWDQVITEPWTSAWSWTWWEIGLDFGPGEGYIEVLADDVSIGQSNWYAMANTKPNDPTIEGKANGEAGVEYEYTFMAEDPDDFDVSYYVDWGDGTNSGWTDYETSGVDVKLKHTWDEEDDYTIECRVRDHAYNTSDWTTLDISMPMNLQASTHPVLEMILARFPNAFPILRYLLEANS